MFTLTQTEASDPQGRKHGDALSVAVVEHHDVLRSVLVEALRRLSRWTVDSVESLPALARLRPGEHPDVVVLDLDLPNEGGTAACSRVRLLHPQAVLVAISSRAESSDRVAALRAGADQLLAKPVSDDELVLDIRRLCSRLRSSTGG